MRELERDIPAQDATPTRAAPPLVIVGRGRAGGAIARAARAGGLEVTLAGRDVDRAAAVEAPGSAAVLLCVPDEAIGQACRAALALGPALVGHSSGASGLEALVGAVEAGVARFSLHPLQTIPAPDAELAGAPCAVAGDDEDALAFARSVAEACGMDPFHVPDGARAAYHAAASIASNFLVALEEAACELLALAGVERPREVLAPLVLRCAANWSELGPAALTGPIARGDEATVARHREAIAELAPELASLYDVLAERTAALARSEGAR